MQVCSEWSLFLQKNSSYTNKVVLVNPISLLFLGLVDSSTLYTVDNGVLLSRSVTATTDTDSENYVFAVKWSRGAKRHGQTSASS